MTEQPTTATETNRTKGRATKVVAASLLLALGAGTVAYSLYSVSGTGQGAVSSAPVTNLVVDVTDVESLLPGQSSDVSVTITNPNVFPVHVTDIAIQEQLDELAAATDLTIDTIIPAGGNVATTLDDALTLDQAVTTPGQTYTFDVVVNGIQHTGTVAPAIPTETITVTGGSGWKLTGTGASYVDDALVLQPDGAYVTSAGTVLDLTGKKVRDLTDVTITQQAAAGATESAIVQFQILTSNGFKTVEMIYQPALDGTLSIIDTKLNVRQDGTAGANLTLDEFKAKYGNAALTGNVYVQAQTAGSGVQVDAIAFDFGADTTTSRVLIDFKA